MSTHFTNTTLAYDPIDETYDSLIFAVEKNKEDFSKAFKAKNHIYDYVFTDSKVEREFAEELDVSAEVKVYAKLPKGFAIPPPVGDYNPDWAIAFDAGKVRHIYFIAETKGSMSSLELRKIGIARIDCARKFFAKITSDQVKYEVVDNYMKIIELVKYVTESQCFEALNSSSAVSNGSFKSMPVS